MKQNAYSIKDDKAQTFGVPFFTHNDGTALRSFQHLADDPSSMVHRHPSDFSLYRTGSYDDQTGKITAEEPTFIKYASVKETLQFEQNTEK